MPHVNTCTYFARSWKTESVKLNCAYKLLVELMKYQLFFGGGILRVIWFCPLIQCMIIAWTPLQNREIKFPEHGCFWGIINFLLKRSVWKECAGVTFKMGGDRKRRLEKFILVRGLVDSIF